ncbi:MAG: bifunctional 5,10-methylenetetrahydrofolate dehydrogenase/5,10-methenyltetrahydrofolate cyclohydrolase [Patescibacteria group bacterium]|nr:bifunctional 5,10-methylenetetrahydrofolate dehydrogenase/5,10-methenyltetrahydrofolate cyclohydrolase [Patescibacteria group bacterium]
MAKLLDGRKLSEKILQKLKKEIKSRHLKLRLAVIQVGDNLVSQIFINQKKKACQMVGIDFKLFKFPASISISELKREIKKVVENPDNSGVIIQLPLPKKFPPEEFLNLIPEGKDIDVLSEKSLGKFYQGTLRILPPTVQGILYLFKNYKISLLEKNVVIVGAGRLVGFPLAIQLLKEKITVSVLNEFTRNTPFFTKKADILVSAVGWPNLIKGNLVKKGVIVIDAGTIMKKGKLVGDVDFKSVSKKASYITPVPGGVGPMTTACLLKNLVKLNIQG